MAGFLRSLPWRLRRAAAVLGLPGIAALLLFAGSAAVWLGLEQPAVDAALQLQADTERLEARGRSTPPSARPAAAVAESPLRRFEQRLPDERRITAELARIHAVAARSGLALERGEFKIASAADDPVAQYSMVMPVKAEYRLLRKFIREVLRDQPALALEEISLRREDPKAPVVDARLRFVLFVTAAR